MLACHKCHGVLADGAAQQSFSEIEAALLARCSKIAAHRRAMMLGPLCDPCLAWWQETFRVTSQPAIVTSDTRSPAMKRLSEACRALGKRAAPATRP